MAELTAVGTFSEAAGRYGLALYEAAAAEGSTVKVERELGEFAKAFAGDNELKSFLTSPIHTLEAKKKVLSELAKDSDRLVRNTLLLLVDKGRIGELEGIFEAFEAYVREAKNQMICSVVAANALDDAKKAEIEKKLAQVTGKNVLVEYTIDESLIGGLVIRAGDRLYDRSVKKTLEDMNAHLTRFKMNTENAPVIQEDKQ